MNACGAGIRLCKENGKPEGTIVIGSKSEKIEGGNFTEIMGKVKISLGCGNGPTACRDKKDCSITRIYKDKVYGTLALT